MFAPPLAPDVLAAFGAPAPRVRVRDALRELAGRPEWARASWTVRQNRLLDEVGSDLRPLVSLLVRAGEGGLPDALPASRGGWTAIRSALVLSLTAHSFLVPEMARWAVECWAYAAGVADEADLTVAADPRVAAWRDAEAHAAARAAAAAAAARRRAAEQPAAEVAERTSTSGAATPGAATPGAVTLAPSRLPAGVPTPTRAVPLPAAGRVGGHAAGSPAPVRVAAAPARARRRGWLPEGLDNPVASLSLVGLVAFGIYVVYSAVRLPAARASEVPRDLGVPGSLAGAGEVRLAAPLGAPGIPGVTTNGLPQSADDSARMIRVTPARRPTYAVEQAPVERPPAMPAPVRALVSGGAVLNGEPRPDRPPTLTGPTPVVVPAAPDGYDRLRLRDGRLLRGRVELVRVAAVVFRDAETGLRYEYPKADVDAVVTEFGSTVRFSPDERPAGTGVGAGAAERAALRLVRRGVGGRYQVTFSVASVTGSPECQRAWQTVPRPDWARVAHVPGADTLAIAFEGGATFASVIDEAAQFASTFVIVPDQAYSGQALTTRLSGRFAEGGFDAAVNLVGYRRVSAGRDVACHTVLRAVGRKTSAVAGGGT